MSKRLLLVLVILLFGRSISWAQTPVSLELNHKIEKSTYTPGQVYMDNDNRTIRIDRVAYYLSNFNLIYNGGLRQTLSADPLLIDGSAKSTYPLGQLNTNSSSLSLEELQFDLGLPYVYNSQHPDDHLSSSPLGNQQMYDETEQSYIFAILEGAVDTDGDQIPDFPFSIQASGDQFLRMVTVSSSINTENNSLRIRLTCNIANWLKDMDLELIGVQQNNSFDVTQLCDNTMDRSVFSSIKTTSVGTIASPENHIYIDTRLSHPTIHYEFHTLELLDMTITNVSGNYFIQRSELTPNGDFYLDENLAAGMYLVIFTSPKGIRQCKRFVIRN